MVTKLYFNATIYPADQHGERRTIAIKGREAWALLNLIEAGVTGCTPITTPGPRWSHYIWLLRGDGFMVETVNEGHGGPFSGSHARYRLHEHVTVDGGNLVEWRPNGVSYPATDRREAA